MAMIQEMRKHHFRHGRIIPVQKYPVSVLILSLTFFMLVAFVRLNRTQSYTIPSLDTLAASVETTAVTSIPSEEVKCAVRVLTEVISANQGRGNSSVVPADVTILTLTSAFNFAEIMLSGRRQLGQFIEDERVICSLALLYLGNCDENGESVFACLQRLGSSALRQVMPERCGRTAYFTELMAAMDHVDTVCGTPTDRAHASTLSVPIVEGTQLILTQYRNSAMTRGQNQQQQQQSTMTAALTPQMLALMLADKSDFVDRAYTSRAPFLEAEEEAIAKAFTLPEDAWPPYTMPPPLHCTAQRKSLSSISSSSSYTVHPIGFALVRRPHNTTFPENKLFDFFPINPSRFESNPQYGDVVEPYYLRSINDEWLYATLLRYSMFAFTHKRGGWDCLRHQEHLFYGAVPVFVDILLAPQRTPSTIPHAMLKDIVTTQPLLSSVGYLNFRSVTPSSTAAAAVPPPPPFNAIANRVCYPVDGTSSCSRSSSLQQSRSYTRCTARCNVDFVRFGEINLEPYMQMHMLHEMKKHGGAEDAVSPLTRHSDVVRKAYRSFAKPLWDLFDSHYSAASMMHYVFNTIGYRPQREPRTKVKKVLVIGNSAFQNDYTHESVIAGLSELGVRSVAYAYTEIDKFRRLSFLDDSPALVGSEGVDIDVKLYEAVSQVNATMTMNEIRTKLAELRQRGWLLDPRVDGMKNVEQHRSARNSEWGFAFTSGGRWNPFVVERAGGATGNPDAQKRRSSMVLDALRARLLEGEFDLVIYSVVRLEITRGRNVEELLPLLRDVREKLPPSRIVLIDHNDIFGGNAALIRRVSQYGHVFQRELLDRCDVGYSPA